MTIVQVYTRTRQQIRLWQLQTSEFDIHTIDCQKSLFMKYDNDGPHEHSATGLKDG